MERNINQDQKGFTLVELLVSIAIVGIVMVAVASFMIVGSRSYASTSSEVNLQYEAQLAFNQLQDLIIDTTLGVTHSYIPAGGAIDDAETLVLRNAPDDAAFKKIYMYNEKVVYIVIWDSARSRLYYEEYNMNSDGTMGTQIVDEARMCDYITDFDVDLTRLADKRIVHVDMGYEKARQTYASSHNITIRNKVIVNADPAEIYTPIIPTGKPEAINVLTPIYLEPGDVFTFPKPVVTGTDHPSQEVRWYIEDVAGGAANTHHAQTVIDVNSGRLQISPYEENDFKVTVKTRDGSVPNYATVNIVRVGAVTISYASNETPAIPAGKLTNNNRFTLTATVTGTHLDDAGITATSLGKSIEDIKQLTWNIVDGAAYFTGAAGVSNYVYLCVMNSAGIVKDMPLKVRATNVRSMTYGSAGDSVVYGEWGGTTFQKDPDFVIVGSGGYSRGAQHAFNVQNRLSDDWSTHIYLYDVTLKEKIYDSEGNVTGYKIIKEHMSSGVAMSGGETNIQLTLPVDLDPYKGYAVDIVCYAFVKHRAWDPSGYYLPYADYDIKDAVGVSNTMSLDVERSDIYFGGDPSKPESLILTKYYIPRTYGQQLNSTEETMMSCSGISNMSGNLQFSGSEFNTGDNNRYKGWVSWKLYTDEKGTNLYVPPSANTGIFGHEDKQQNFKIYFRKGKWYEDVPQRLYLIPTLTIQNLTKNTENSWLMNHTHIEYINYNITVPKNGENNNLYFPYPAASDFPGKSLKDNGTKTGTWYNAFNFKNQIYYELKRYRNSDGAVNYTLELKNGSTIYGKYTIGESELVWTKVGN